jgi:hypothetical protein
MFRIPAGRLRVEVRFCRIGANSVALRGKISLLALRLFGLVIVSLFRVYLSWLLPAASRWVLFLAHCFVRRRGAQRRTFEYAFFRSSRLPRTASKNNTHTLDEKQRIASSDAAVLNDVLLSTPFSAPHVFLMPRIAYNKIPLSTVNIGNRGSCPCVGRADQQVGSSDLASPIGSK